MLIEEYEQQLAQRTADRIAAEDKARQTNDRYKKAKEKLDQDIINGEIWKHFYYTHA